MSSMPARHGRDDVLGTMHRVLVGRPALAWLGSGPKNKDRSFGHFLEKGLKPRLAVWNTFQGWA